ncbi:MAG: anti-sigma F factor [Ruminococcus sp.]|jgi:stage II sporulation protein AB (anti-sigma F factor)|nr:anti-sigma F factor [Ruminococcus sp.]
MKPINEMKMIFLSAPENENLARMTVSAFVSKLNPPVGEIAEIKTAVSEAVTNCIVHAYRARKGLITLAVKALPDGRVYIKITDKGCGIPDIEKAREPLWTSRPEEDRAGLGFAVMESFCDKMTVKSAPEKGTTVTLVKRLTLST